MGSLTVHVVNDDGDPVRGKRVFVNFVGSFLGIADTHLEDYTDSDGTVEFDDIPTGSVEVRSLLRIAAPDLPQGLT